MATRIVIAFILLTFITGCTEYRSLQRTEGSPAHYDFSRGDTVELTTETMGIVTLEITEIGENSLEGFDLGSTVTTVREIEFSEIKQASIKKLDIGSTAKGIGISLGAVFAFILALAFAAYGHVGG